MESVHLFKWGWGPFKHTPQSKIKVRKNGFFRLQSIIFRGKLTQDLETSPNGKYTPDKKGELVEFFVCTNIKANKCSCNG
jgi:hypothetical protein